VIGAAFLVGDITWWENDGAGGGWTTETISDNFNGAKGVTTGDIDGDGDLDVIGSARYADDITWWENDGAGGGWTTETISDNFNGAISVIAGDIDGDGDLDVIGAASSADDITWWESQGGQFGLETADTAPASLNAGLTDDLLAIDFTHNGISGDNDMKLATIELRLEGLTSSFADMTTGEAQAIIQNIHIYLDDGSDAFEIGSDTLVTTTTQADFSVMSGIMTIPLSDDDSNAQLAQADGSKRFFVVVELDAGLEGDVARAGITQIRLTHITENSSTAEDTTNDGGLGMQFVANQASGDMQLNNPTAVTLIDLGLEETPESRGLWVAVTAALAGVLGTAAVWRRRLLG